MKVDISKEWCEQAAKTENGCEVGAGIPPAPKTGVQPMQKRVSESMENATDNGYEFEAWTFTELAEDLISNVKGFEDSKLEELRPLVKEWFLSSGVLYRMYDA